WRKGERIDPGKRHTSRYAMQARPDAADEDEVAEVKQEHDHAENRGEATIAIAPEQLKDERFEEGRDGRKFTPPVAERKQPLAGKRTQLEVIHEIAASRHTALDALREQGLIGKQEHHTEEDKENEQQAKIRQEIRDLK